MFSFEPSLGFDAGCQAVNVVDQKARALLEHPVALLELAVTATLVFLCASILEHPAVTGWVTCVGTPCLQTNRSVNLIGQNRSCVRPLLQASSNDLLRRCRNQLIKRPSCLISVCR
jgi:hypothetical protein